MRKLILLTACVLVMAADARADLIFFNDSTYFRGRITEETKNSVTGIAPDGREQKFKKIKYMKSSVRL